VTSTRAGHIKTKSPTLNSWAFLCCICKIIVLHLPN
jgi:hypothetical protein